MTADGCGRIKFKVPTLSPSQPVRWIIAAWHGADEANPSLHSALRTVPRRIGLSPGHDLPDEYPKAE